jgi:hypothetical protein
MDPVEILSRCKLLFEDNQQFDDLRKSVANNDLNSIFRYIGDEKFEDLRKAVVENNLHSLFRLFGEAHEDFRKLVLEKNHFSLIRSLQDLTDSRMIDVFDMIAKDETIDPDCVSRSQIRCKKWLVEELEKHDINLGTVFLCAGWYGLLAIMMFESKLKLTKIRNFDVDDSCRLIAEKFNNPWVVDDWKYKHCTQDIHEINYDTHVYNVLRGNGTPCELTDSPDTIINTSCEHIENFDAWYNKIPAGKFVILQTNNFNEIDEHINCCNDVDEFVKQTPMTQRLFHGELETPNYKRFMTFGYK